MTAPERTFYEEYSTAVQSHLEATVTNHFPATDDWRTIPDESVDKEVFCFVETLEDVTIEKKLHETGTRLIVRYPMIRELLLDDKVALL